MTDNKKNEAPSESPKSEETANKEEKAALQSVENLTGGKFKSPEDLAKAYKELEKKFGENSAEVRQVREFMSVAQPVFDVIKADDTLFKMIDEKLRKDENDSDKKNKSDAKEKTTDQDEVKSTTRDMLRLQFESKHSFDKLSADEQGKLRGEIGKVINELTGRDYNGIDLRRLPSVLENAYVLAKNRIEDKSTLEAIAQAEKTDEASMSSIPSSGGKSEETLSSDEATVAERLGLTREQYVSGKSK